jgi:YbbR domain-containing protein
MVIAVLMAVVLWLFVRTGAQPMGQRTILTPVSVTNNPAHFGVSPKQVEVRLEGGTSAVDRLSADEVAVIADLAGRHEGDLVTLTVVPPQGFKVQGLSVTQVRVLAPERTP